MTQMNRRQFIKGGFKTAIAAAIGRLFWSPSTIISSGSFVTALWCGALKSNSARFKAQIDHTSTKVRIHLSTQPDLSNPFVSPEQTANPSNNFMIDLTAISLQPDTHYYYGIADDGFVDTNHIGHFLTPGDGYYSFSFALGSCANTDSNHEVFTAIDEADPLFFLHLGDLHYRNISQNEPHQYRGAYQHLFTLSRQAALYRNRPVAYIWDDHDYGPNDSDATSPSREAARLVYREFVPSYSLPAGSGNAAIYQAFTIGRVRFILSDLRSERTPKLAPDNAAKTMMGAAQKAWFKDQLLAAKDAAYPLIVWASTMPWIDAATGGADTWGGYTTERQELANFIRNNNIPPILIVSGDAHMLAIDDGTNSDYATGGGAAMPVFHGAALDRSGSVKGGPYSHGAFPERGQFGLVTIQDDGGQMTVQLSGRKSLVGGGSEEVVGYTFSFLVDPYQTFLPAIMS